MTSLEGDGWDQWQAADNLIALFKRLQIFTAEDRLDAAISLSPDKNWAVAGDLRLSDRENLGARLGLSPTEAAAMGDNGLVARAFMQWGRSAPERLIGGFSLIAWQLRERKLHLFVDPMRLKALYYHRGPGWVAVSNRLVDLFAIPGVPREVDVPAILRFFTDQRLPGGTTLRGIEAVPPGSGVTVGEDGHIETFRWWRPPVFRVRREKADTVERFRELFSVAVGEGLRSLGNAGSFCSGGLDSTSVSAVAASLLAQRGRRFRTYTSVPHPDWREGNRNTVWQSDERPYLKALARKHPNIDATFVAVSGGLFIDHLPLVFSRSAHPVRNTANTPWKAAIRERMIADGIVVPMTGAWGNPTMSFDSEILADLLAAGRLDLVCAEFGANPLAFAHSTKRLFAAFLRPADPLPTVEKWRRRVAIRPAAAIAHGLDPSDGTRYRLFPSRTRSLQKFQIVRESMFRSPGETRLEGFDPTADLRLAEFCWGLSPTEFHRGGETRRLIRRAMDGILPDAIRLRTTRGDQAPDHWLHLGRRRADLQDAVEFIAGNALCAELLDLESLRRTLKEWPAAYDHALFTHLTPFVRAISMGLYICWINDRLTELPGSRIPASPIIEVLEAQ